MRRDARRGSAAIEFAFIAPVFVLFMMGTIEVGAMYMANSVLQKATDDGARLVRTGQAQSATMTQAQFRDYICGRIAAIIPCDSNLQIDMRTYSGFGSAAYTSPVSNGALNASLNSYQTGSAGDVVLVRVFYQWKLITPLIGTLLGNLSNGRHLISATAAFQNEPF